MSDETPLPKGWVLTRCSDFCAGRNQTFNPAKAGDQEFVLYSVPSHETGKPETVRASEIGSNKQFVSAGDTLISKINPRLNRTWVVSRHPGKQIIASTEWIVFGRSSALIPEFLAYFLQQGVVRDFLSHNASGVGGSLTRVRASIFEEVSFPLPPLPEQKRIVAKIEELFSELEAGEERLRVAQRQLGVYRQSLLKQAFEGELTKTWRTQNPAKLESPATLLARIQSEASDSRHPQARQIDGDQENNAVAIYVNLPARWVHVRLRDLGTAITGNTPPTSDEANYGSEVPFVKPPDLTNHPVSKTQAYLSQKGSELGRVLPERSVLVTCIGNLGRVGINRVPAAFNQQINAVVPHPSVDPFFLFYAAQSPVFRHQLEGLASATTISIVNKGNFEKIVVTLCSLPEQQEIVRLLDEQLAGIERNEREIDGALRKSEALRQAILKKAFTGRLVPQDSSDEPASVLLARLKASRAVDVSISQRNKSTAKHP